MLEKLEKFQGDLGKKILNIPKHYSNLIPLVALKWSTIRLQILHRKMAFLWRNLHSKITIYISVFKSLPEKGWSPPHSTVQVPGKCLWNPLYRVSSLSEHQQWSESSLPKGHQKSLGRKGSRVHLGASVNKRESSFTHSRCLLAEALGKAYQEQEL